MQRFMGTSLFFVDPLLVAASGAISDSLSVAWERIVLSPGAWLLAQASCRAGGSAWDGAGVNACGRGARAGFEAQNFCAF
jgi:hypothetical protein